MTRFHWLLAATITLAPVSVAWSQDQAAATPSLQGGGAEQQFMSDPNLHAFYDLSVARLGRNAPALDFADYQARSFALFRQMGAHMGMTPEQMQDHLKLIPGQMVQIVKDDPKVLDSFDNFVAALVGPR